MSEAQETHKLERRIDIPYLMFAWQDDSPDNAYYLDTKNGDIKLVNRNLLDLRDLTDEIEKTRERFLYVPKPDKQTLLADLHDFAHAIKKDQLKPVLDVAFESPHVLSAFRKILENHPEELKNLNEYLEEKVLKRIHTWLAANAVPEVWTVEEEDFDDEDEDDDDYERQDFSV
jgi:hypothetical protein